MAPKAKKTKASDSPSPGVVTRSAARRNASLPTVYADPEPRKKKAKTTASTSAAAGAGARVKQEPGTDVPEPETDVLDGSKTIVIEHCKQCSSFKTRAAQVKDGLEESVAGIKVVVNPEKPRKGCFEVREEGGDVFISLLDMKRPFTPMKNLNMEEVIADIVEKIK